jgi:hypothetical protein
VVVTVTQNPEPFIPDQDIVWITGLLTGAGALLIAATLVLAYALAPLFYGRSPRTRWTKLSAQLFDGARVATWTWAITALVAGFVAVIVQYSQTLNQAVAWAEEQYGYELSDTQMGQLMDADISYTVLPDGTIVDASHSPDGLYLIIRAPGTPRSLNQGGEPTP